MRITASTITGLRRGAKDRGMRIAAIRPAPEGFSALLVRPDGPSLAQAVEARRRHDAPMGSSFLRPARF